MNRLKDVIKFPDYYPVTCHTDYVGPDTTFVAIKGFDSNGIDYIPLALEKGASKIVVDYTSELDDSLKKLLSTYNAELVFVENTRKALADLAAQALGYPAHDLSIIGVTGTKGKTTTAYLIEHILQQAGYKTALISSVAKRIGNCDLSVPLTTPQPDYIQLFLSLCKEHKVDYVIMEVAAQALSLHRVENIEFSGVVFTNFSLEHSEFYATQKDYFEAKKKILLQRKPSAPLILNSDDENIYALRLKYKKVVTFGLEPWADIQATAINSSLQGLSADLHAHSVPYYLTLEKLVGAFNIYNIAAAFALTQSLGIQGFVIIRALQSFKAPRGRLEKYILPNKAIAFIDYAHNPSSFKALFKTLRPLASDIKVVFGAGGGKDHSKRPVMGALAAEYADTVILTSDNPRSEDPQKIIESIKAGIPDSYEKKVYIELDRKKAIEKAYQLSHEDSIILILGKGPDEYQIVGRDKIYFSEAAILANL